ncbi:MAG: hypothetical protein RIR70_1037 [Pseudomonadota bacterium]|jgi:phenylalanine-4-hydroxylase
MDSTHPKHGLAAGDGAQPERADWTVPQNWAHYSAADHAVWKTLFNRQMKRLPGRACEAFVAGMRRLPLVADRIPDFDAVNEVLEKRTGWRIVAVPGLIPDEVFFAHLAARRFPAGNFIRAADQLDYIQEPDVFHDVFGHVPMLLNPAIADFIAAYGEGGLRAAKLGTLPMLSRVYWYTVEFGLLEEAGSLRLYGAGMASSFTESRFCLESPSPNRIRFDLQRVMRTHYRIDDFQETYFVLHDLDELLAFTEIDFAPLYAAASAKETLEPGIILPEDNVISAGDQSYPLGRKPPGRC